MHWPGSLANYYNKTLLMFESVFLFRNFSRKKKQQAILRQPFACATNKEQGTLSIISACL
jgi:hypothetical protein